MRIRPVKTAMDEGPKGEGEMQVTWRLPGFAPVAAESYSGVGKSHEAIIPEWARQAVLERGLADNDGEVVLDWAGEWGHLGYGDDVKTSQGFFEFTVVDVRLTVGFDDPELSPDDAKPITLEVPAGARGEVDNFAKEWFGDEAREYGEKLVREYEEPDYEELAELERMDEYELRGLDRPGREFL